MTPDADTPAKGIAQSHGIMVNCLYELDKVEARHEACAAGADLAVSRAVPAGSSNPRPRAGKTMAEETDNA